jgi:transcriptional regulator with PAS, ATPase and Fis domain
MSAERHRRSGASDRTLEQANGGTIFLDEIGEIDSTTQVKLLRVLARSAPSSESAATPIKVDVRLVAATNKDLSKMVSEGKIPR